MTVTDEINHLRSAMSEHKLNAWILTSADPHASEYAPDYWQGRVM